MSAVPSIDAGPIARLDEVKADAGAPSVIFQRLTDGETLQQIAKAWGLPRGRFVEWFTTEHEALYDAALRARADELAHEALGVADEQKEAVRRDGSTFDPDVARDKLRVETRLRLAAHWDRTRYGAAKDAGSGGVTVLVDRSCGGAIAIQAGDTKVLVAGGVSQEIEVRGTEASAAPAAITQEI